jgi:polysaccharide deacetylase 2 family uncharacterized protein YibQ
MKKKKKSKKTQSTYYKYIIYVLSILILGLGAVLFYLILEKKDVEKKIASQENAIKKLEKKVSTLEKELKKKPKKEILTFSIPSEAKDYELSLKKSKNTTPPPPVKTVKTNTPKLVIIIDDMSFKYQVNLLKQIPFHITPSFFPPTKRHPNTPKYAREFSHYMVHLPMEAMHFNKPEPNTLLVNDPITTIEKRIEYIKKIFPKARFINNHTGSKFTSDYEAMYKLFYTLKENNLGFVDSKTTPNSKAYLVDKIFNIPLFSRNIFLDNKEDKTYIRNQLKKAIKLAKKRGYAIAIGHPHKITLETLKNSGDLLSQVKVVYIDELANSIHK